MWSPSDIIVTTVNRSGFETLAKPSNHFYNTVYSVRNRWLICDVTIISIGDHIIIHTLILKTLARQKMFKIPVACQRLSCNEMCEHTVSACIMSSHYAK